MSDPIEFADDAKSLSARHQDDELHPNDNAPCKGSIKDIQEKVPMGYAH